MKVSVVIPMYHGKIYLGNILKQIETCAQYARNVDVELTLYNDSPDEEVKVCGNQYSYQINVINPGCNSGIHGARVRGLKNSTGEYVLFLDQDDKLAPSYLVKQLECIGSADAAVCRVINNNRLHYTNTHVFEKVISKEFMLKKWCPIVSPGQVLLKRASIPEIWKQNIIKHNGADDYFLWLLMAGEGKSFSLNQEILFEHVATGMNTSGDTNEMMDSECEMIKILETSHVFQGEEEEWLHKLPESLRRIHIKELDNYKGSFSFFQKWMQKVSVGISPIALFEKRKWNKIAMYGDLGKCLEMLLKDTGIEVKFFIDQNAEYIISELPVYRKEKVQGEVDAVIMTIKDDVIVKELEKIVKCPVYGIDEIWQ